MSRRRRDTLVATCALLAVAALTISPAGAEIRRALSARNASTVNGVKASLSPRPNALVALNSAAQIPRRTIRPGGGARGLRGEQGPSGAPGPRGGPGPEGPGAARMLRGARNFGPFADSFDVTPITATGLGAGTWLATGTAVLRRASGGEFLGSCNVTDGLTSYVGTGASLGAESGNTGVLQQTVIATGVFRSDLPFDIGLRCTGQRFGGSGPGLFVEDPTLLIVPLPAAAVRLTGA